MKYCNNCKQMVEPQTKFNWCAFLILLCVFGLGLLYLIYFLFKRGRCPICNSTNWGVRPSEEQGVVFTQPDPQPVAASQSPPPQYQYCSACGEQIVKGNEYCSFCGARQ